MELHLSGRLNSFFQSEDRPKTIIQKGLLLHICLDWIRYKFIEEG